MTWPWVSRSVLVAERAHRDAVVDLLREEVHSWRMRYDELSQEYVRLKAAGYERAPETPDLPRPEPLPSPIVDTIRRVYGDTPAVARAQMAFARSKLAEDMDPTAVARLIEAGELVEL